MVEEEIKSLKEKFKTNFFQIEKLLAGYDNRLDNIERKKLKDVDKKIDELEKTIKGSKKSEIKIIEDAKHNFLDIIKKMEESYKDRLRDIEDKHMKLVKNNERITNLIEKKCEEFGEIEKNIRERIERVEVLGSKLEEMERLVGEFDKKSEEWNIFRDDLERDKNLYLELREVVLASVEKLKNFEKLFSKNIEEFGEINERVEEDEKLFEKLSAETRKELQRLDSERKRIEQNVEEFKNKLKERLIKKFSDLDFKLESEIKSKIREQDSLLSSYGGVFTKLEANMKGIENEVIPRKIDMEFNEMLLVLNNKLKDLISRQDFDMLEAKLKNEVEQIRKPEMKPIEDKVLRVEEDINELKRLLRGISQRLPVIVD